MAPYPNQHSQYSEDLRFTFLNREHRFDSGIDWNYGGHGKLWTYHLNYFDYLHQPGLNWETGKSLMDDFIGKAGMSVDGFEPYPISLRTINWIKFLAKHDQWPQEVVDSLCAQNQVLQKKLEYHLLGNHLLENGFSLLFGAVFFEDKTMERAARAILKDELHEQILEDGAHFELSPMYHLIMLQRALDCYNLLANNRHEMDDIQQLLAIKIQKMVNWMQTMSFNSGEYPMFNDSTAGQALEAPTVLVYANTLGFHPVAALLGASGYRKFTNCEFCTVVDVGEIGPSYQPGHAHCDLLSFVLHHKNVPLIVDRGVSTYEKNALREEERGTASHNTVMINDTEQSDVWGGFRVGRRAKPVILKDQSDHLIATHTRYDVIDARHQREWIFDDTGITINDTVTGKIHNATAHVHFHPEVVVRPLGHYGFEVGPLLITFSGAASAEISDYAYCEGFNKTRKAKKLVVSFGSRLTTRIEEKS
jgi:uncharacterized heparinase superfamily protein